MLRRQSVGGAATLRITVATLLTLLAGCSLLDDDVVVESQLRPGVEIACQGEVRLTADACRTWGDELLADPIAPEDVTRLVLSANAGNARCAADFYAGEGRSVAVTAAVVCP